MREHRNSGTRALILLTREAPEELAQRPNLPTARIRTKAGKSSSKIANTVAKAGTIQIGKPTVWEIVALEAQHRAIG